MKTMKNLILAALFVCTMAVTSQATALTGNSTIAQRADDKVGLHITSNQTIYVGALIAVDSSGTAVNAADSVSSNQVVGVAEGWVDSTGSNYDSSKWLTVRQGCIRLKAAGTFTKADIGQFCYVADNATVTLATNTTYAIPAGIIEDVDSLGVWVHIGPLSRALAGNLATLAVSGNGSVGGTLAVTGDTTVGGTLGVTGATTLSGTLAVTGASTFTAAPVMVSTSACGTVTGTLTNLPASASTVAAFFTFKIGANSYAVPGYKLP